MLDLCLRRKKTPATGAGAITRAKKYDFKMESPRFPRSPGLRVNEF